MLRGDGVADAAVSFGPGANVLAGASDTGKSYLVRCLDYILGGDAMEKRIPQAEPYSQLLVEFRNPAGEHLTLERSLAGGDLAAYRAGLEDLAGAEAEKVAASRSGRSEAKDVTAVLFEFAGISEARLRKDAKGVTQRLTIRTMLAMILVDEIAVIDETSPVLGRASFDQTARKRAFAYMLTGKDDSGVIAAERKDIVNARLGAQLGVIDDLLRPLEERLKARPADDDSIERTEEAIASRAAALADHSAERDGLEDERREALADLRRAETQTLAIDQLLQQYGLLDDRYRTDLDRLDFIADASHFFDGLQEVRCPLCDQIMSADHSHTAAERSEPIYASARAEAGKILALRTDLAAATTTLRQRREVRAGESADRSHRIKQIDERLAALAPAMQDASEQLERLLERRLRLEAARSDEAMASSLRHMREEAERAAAEGQGTAKKWEDLPGTALRAFCDEVEHVLKEWNWKGPGRVEFDQSRYDIIVDGQARQSRGKGLRAILYSAFVIGLLRYCEARQRPHLGVVVLDSPLTSYKKGSGGSAEAPVSIDIEAAFWASLTAFKGSGQLIVIENKEPPDQVADAVHYEWFAGEDGPEGQRAGFIP